VTDDDDDDDDKFKWVPCHYCTTFPQKERLSRYRVQTRLDLRYFKIRNLKIN